LIGDLEGEYGKIADGNELESILNDIEDDGYGEFPTIGTENVVQRSQMTDIKKKVSGDVKMKDDSNVGYGGNVEDGLWIRRENG
jgi:hypothetical protein